MKILLRYRTCEITFDTTDPFYAGKTLEFQGEAFDDKTFHILRSEKIYWIVPSPEKPDHCIGITVDDSDKENLFSYVIEKAQETGYRFVLW